MNITPMNIQPMTIEDLNNATLQDLRDIDHALITLARYEHATTRDTFVADGATRALMRIARRYNLTTETN